MNRIRIVLLIFSLMTVQMVASEESECTDVTLVWRERVSIEEYTFEATEFSFGDASEIRIGESVWALVTIYKNNSAVWRDIFSTNETFWDYMYDANESAYTFDLDCTGTYLENGTDRIRINASEIVIGSTPPTQKIDVSICIIEPPPPPPVISFGEWINNTFSVSKSATTGVYVREKVFIEIEITNISMADRVEITDSIPDEFVVDPDRDLYWNYFPDMYRYSVTPLVPGTYTLPAANASVWCHGYIINIKSNTPEVTVNGPYIEITKTAEVADDVVDVTVSVCNTGDHDAMVYVFDSIPEGAELLEGVLNFSKALNPVGSGYTSEYVNKYKIKINGSAVLPCAVAYYQTSKQIDTVIEYRPEATFEIEKYINPKFYAARSMSSEIMIGYGTDAGTDVSEPVSEDTPETINGTDNNHSSGQTPSQTPSQTSTQEKEGFVQKIKKIPGFGVLFTMFGLLTGYLILRNHDVI